MILGKKGMCIGKIFLWIIPFAVLITIIIFNKYKNDKSYKYKTCQIVSINNDILNKQKINKSIIYNVLDRTYFETDKTAGFNSRYIAVDFLHDLTWKKVYCSLRLVSAYKNDSNNMLNNSQEVAKRVIKSIDYDNVTIPEIHELLILNDDYEIDIDKNKLIKKMEDYYNSKSGMYMFDGLTSKESQVEATYFALLIFEKMEQEMPHKSEIVNAIKKLYETENFFSGDYYPEFWILTNKKLDRSDYDDDFVEKYKSYINNKINTYNNIINSNEKIDSIELFYSYYCIKATKELGLDTTELADTIKKIVGCISMSDIVSSKEITDAAIELEKKESWGIKIFFPVKDQIEDYVLNNFETGFVGNYDENIETNSMDTYYGICLSDLCNYKYNKKKINKQMNEWIETHLSQEDSNQYLFVFFDILVSDKTQYKFKNTQLKKIKILCKKYFENCSNLTLSDDENVKLFLDQTLFVVEICKLTDVEILNKDKKIIMSILNDIITEGLVDNTSYISECRLIADVLEENINIKNEDETCEKLLSNGGYAPVEGDNLENIITTGKMSRVDEYKEYLDKASLKDFLDSFIVDNKLCYNREEVGADLRTYYWYLGLYCYSIG